MNMKSSLKMLLVTAGVSLAGLVLAPDAFAQNNKISSGIQGSHSTIPVNTGAAARNVIYDIGPSPLNYEARYNQTGLKIRYNMAEGNFTLAMHGVQQDPNNPNKENHINLEGYTDRTGAPDYSADRNNNYIVIEELKFENASSRFAKVRFVIHEASGVADGPNVRPGRMIQNGAVEMMPTGQKRHNENIIIKTEVEVDFADGSNNPFKDNQFAARRLMSDVANGVKFNTNKLTAFTMYDHDLDRIQQTPVRLARTYKKEQ